MQQDSQKLILKIIKCIYFCQKKKHKMVHYLSPFLGDNEDILEQNITDVWTLNFSSINLNVFILQVILPIALD